jgi:hypothetical protein
MSIGLYYKPITIVNDYSSVVNKLETSLIDEAIVIIYDHHMFIVQATGVIGRTRTHNFQMTRLVFNHCATASSQIQFAVWMEIF